MLQYVDYLQEKGITHYVVQFDKSYGEKLMPVLKELKDLITPTGGNIHVGITKDDKYAVFVLIPEMES
jgi:hypothetical protein